MKRETFLERFITNEWGIIRHQRETLGAAQDDVPNSPIMEIDLKPETEENCLLTNQILNKPASCYKILHVNDYNPHLVKDCNGASLESHQIIILLLFIN